MYKNVTQNNLKQACKTKATCNNDFCVIAKVISRLSLQNFMKNIPNFSEEIEKNTKNVPPNPLSPPPKNKTQNSPPGKRQYAHIKIFSLTAIRVLSKIPVKNFIRSQMVLKIQKNIPQDRPKNTLKLAPGEDLTLRFVQCSKH